MQIQTTVTDSGGVRPVVARWVIMGKLRVTSAAHFGGLDDELADMMVIRDAREGAPLLPGASLAGALRNHLADILGGYGSKEVEAVSRLFGGARADDFGGQSPLIFFDAVGQLPSGHSFEIRDGVAIDPPTSTAETHKKYDMELLPAGTTFPFRVELQVEDAQQEDEQLRFLAATLSGLENGELALGARRSRGLGRVRVGEWRIRRYKLTAAAGWMEWLSADPREPLKGVPQQSSLQDAFRAANVELGAVADRRRRTTAQVNLAFPAGLLVRSPGAGADSPDAVHLTSAGHSVLPGTSLTGALRARCLRVSKAVRSGKEDGELWVSRMFGPRLQEGKDRRVAPRASRLRIEESAADQVSRMRCTRIGIDRFTQGVVHGALFDEEPEYGGGWTVRFELRDPQPGEEGLLLLLLKDLLSGDLAVGGSSSVGRGFAQGSACVCFADGRQVTVDPASKPEPDALEILNAAIREFHARERLPLQEGANQ